ncbi:MAG: SusC/RagA family TonB-linked outer membrane protein [Cytophagia bacterium]|nr:SusC/RagA family TonB-linked outer membrane protein [Cytophagia bacterium]
MFPGNYKLSVPAGGSPSLVFSFIGLNTTEIAIGERSIVDVSLGLDVTQLNEVVVVGYGTQLKQDLTGNIAKVNGEAIQNLSVTTFEQAMQGRAAGVLVTQQNGKLGQGLNIRIRGSSSISAGNEPLYVVDGMIINNDNLSGTDAATNALADLNSNDIASLEILKDAAASAIYGARAANGVVLITTKRGKAGKTNFTANYQFGSSQPTRHREFLNSAQYVELMRESAYNNDLRSGYDPINNPADYPDSWLEFWEGYMDYLGGHTDWRTLETNTDWEKEAYQKANFNSLDFTASGGTDKTTFYFGGGLTDQDGILIGNSFRRISGRLNLDHKATDKLSFGMNVNIANTINNRVTDDNEFSTPLQLVAQAPITPVRDAEGRLYDNSLNPSMSYYPATVELENAEFTTRVFRNIVATNATYKISKDLRLVGEYGFDLLTQNESRYQNEFTEVGRAVGGYGRSRWTQVFNSTARALLILDKNIAKHSISATFGTELLEKRIDFQDAQGQGFPIPNMKKLTSAATPVSLAGTLNEESYTSFYTRANYKGLTGNASIPDYRYLQLYNGIGYGGTPGLQPGQLENNDLRWEKTAQLDIGFDFGLFNDKLTGEFDYYNKQTSDLLLDKPVPATSGYTTVYENIGELENKGFELVLNYTVVKTSDLSVTIGGNYAANRNKVLKLNEGQTQIGPTGSRFLNAVIVGQPIGTFFGREYAGVDPDNGDALWYVNGENTGSATTNNFNLANPVVLGNPTPTSIYGFTTNATFKGFELSVLFQGVAGNKVFDGAGSFMSANGRYEDNSTIDQLRRWQKPGDVTDVPQARLYGNNGAQSSSRFLYDASYLRLKTLTVAYNFPASMISRFKLSSARLYVTGQNLLTFTDYKGWDPEVNTDAFASNIDLGNDFYAAPQAKTLTVGIKVGF